MTREEAIEVYNNLPNQKIKEAFEVLVPELHESEDENTSIMRKKDEEYVDSLISHLSEGGALSCDLSGTISFLKRLKSLRPQPKQEWSDEEMKVLNSIIDDYEKAAKSFCGYDGKIGLLKAIRDGEYDLPKQEWSEEDERMRKAVLDEIEHQIEIMPDADDMDSDDQDRYNELISMSVWMENLPKCMKPHWKPSEEQPEVKNGKFVFPKYLYARTKDNKTIDMSYAPQDMTAVEYIRNDSVEQEQPEVDLKNYISNKLRELGADLIKHKPYSFNRGLNVGKANAYNDILDRLNARK